MKALLQQVLLLLALNHCEPLVATLKTPSAVAPVDRRNRIYHRTPTPYEVPEAALATLEADGIVVVDDWAPPADVQALRRDVDHLWDAGKFIASKVGSRSVSADGSLTNSRTMEEETRRAQTAWLRPPPDPSVGNVEARRKLDGVLKGLREKLIENSGAPLMRTMELSYAKYPVGGYYRRHIDVPRKVYYELGRNGATDYSLQERREYSILLYLNARDWEHEEHGGALKAEVGAKTLSVSPKGGRLVVFHSDCIPHAVEEAPERGRVAVVGWFRTRQSDEATSLKESPRFKAAETLERFGHDGSAKRQFQRCLEHLTDPVEKAYCYARVAHCAFDGLNDREAAAGAWRSAIELDPGSAVARAGLGMTSTNKTERAEALNEAQALQPRDARTALLRAATSEDEAERVVIIDGLLASNAETYCLAESLLWLHDHNFDSSSALEPTRSVLEQAADAAVATFGDDENNICAEFGTYHGRSLRVLDRRLPTNWQLHGFDSFVGLPEQWRHEPAGSYSVTGDRGELTGCFPDRAELHAGWFNETSAPFATRVRENEDVLALLHVDCDLYSSARDCLSELAPLLVKGSVVLFDDFLAHETWREDEKRAWEEAVAENGLEVEVVAASLLSKQCCFRVVGVG